MSNIYSFLSEHGIRYERFDHPAVFTCEESEALNLNMPGSDTKNLFLKDKNGKRHFLVSVRHDKKVNLKELSTVLDAKNLSFASPDRLMKYLGVEPGSVTILGLMNDVDHAVELFIDEDVWKEDAIQCHPLVNTATLVIEKPGMEAFLKATGHVVHVSAIPGQA